MRIISIIYLDHLSIDLTHSSTHSDTCVHILHSFIIITIITLVMSLCAFYGRDSPCFALQHSNLPIYATDIYPSLSLSNLLFSLTLATRARTDPIIIPIVTPYHA